MLDSDRKVRARAVAEHVFRDCDVITGAYVAAAETGGTAVEFRNAIDFGITRRAGDCVGECCLDFAKQRIGLHHRYVKSLDDRNAFAVSKRFDDFDRWEWP